MGRVLQISFGWDSRYDDGGPDLWLSGGKRMSLKLSHAYKQITQALPVAPLLSDGIGRRRALCLGSTILCGGVVLQAMATGVAHFVASRCMGTPWTHRLPRNPLTTMPTVGVGLCFATNAAPLLVTELAYPTQRAPITALYNSSWYLGSIISAWVTYATLKTLHGSMWAWR